MTDPTRYTRGYSFSGFQASNPAKSLPGTSLDNELENLEAATAALADAVDLINGGSFVDSKVGASQDQAEQGVDNSRAMTALRSKQAIDYQRPRADQALAEAGADATAVMSPLTTKQAIAAQRVHVSVKDRGAKGDGVTDDTTAIQAAINLGGTIVFPAGTYVAAGLTGIDNVRILALGNVIIRRPVSAVASTPILSFTSKSGFRIEGVNFDGNKANNTVGANNVEIVGCSNYAVVSVLSRNAKANAGYGSGLAIVAGGNQSAKRRGVVRDGVYRGNEGSGIYVNREFYVDIENNVCEGNTVDGLQVANLVYPAVSDVVQGMRVVGNRFIANTQNGFNFIGFYTVVGSIGTVLGWTTPPARFVEIRGNLCQGNTLYGGLWQGSEGVVSGNFFYANGTTGGFGGGLCANCDHSSITDNDFNNNQNFQLDAGGGYSIQILGNRFREGGMSLATATVDLNVGGTQRCIVADNVIEQSGSHAMTGVKAIGVEGTTSANPIDQAGIGITITGNRVSSNGAASSIGVFLTSGFEWAIVKDNDVAGAAAGRAYFLEVERLLQEGNTSSEIFATSQAVQTVASASTLIIPDVGEKFFISGTTGFSTIRTVSANSYSQKVRNVAILTKGSGYTRTSPPTVSFSGGGGTGAAATAQIDNSGKVVGVLMTNYGSGYTSAPTVGISGGTGSGATATAQVGCNNFEGREITLIFQGVLTVTQGAGNINMATNLTTSASTVVKFVGAYGSWYRVT